MVRYRAAPSVPELEGFMSPSGFIEPCLPSPRHPAPTGLHQIKHYGDLLMARRGIRLLTRKGHEWAPRYPLIVAAVNYSRCGPA
jgi:hypothetical protein